MKFFWLVLLFHTPVSAQQLDFFVIGDSQLSYAHHTGYSDFINNLYLRCRDIPEFKTLDQPTFSHSGFAVSGAGMSRWLDKNRLRQKWEHGDVCNKDDHHRFFGAGGNVVFENTFEKNERDKFCKEGLSPLEVVAALNPRVVVANFLGNENGTPADMKKNIDTFTKTLPERVSCVIITSPPAFNFNNMPPDLGKDYIDLMKKKGELSTIAQFSKWRAYRRSLALNFHKAIRENGRCELIEGTNFKMQKLISNDYLNYNAWSGIEDGKKIVVSPDMYHLSARGSIKFLILRGLKFVRLSPKL